MKKTLKAAIEEIETHREKVYWPKEGYTKGQLLDYYEAISPFILPYLKGRPISLKRFPNGINGEFFFQKNLIHHPDWVTTVSIEHTEKDVNYLIINNLLSLLYTVNLGAIELHPFLSRYPDIDHPDFLVLDLDPVEIDFEAVIEVAQATHEVLGNFKIGSYCKTSGKRGLHIFIPIKTDYDQEQVKGFAELLANLIHNKIPSITSLEREPSKRKNKVYIDYLQNGRTKTVVAPYVVRAIEGAPVSTPLDWKEVKKGLDPGKFTMDAVLKRVEKGDVWQGVFKKPVNLAVCFKKIEKFLTKKLG
jgi:bifunctional non-homologous end joining protein LigD